MNHKLIPGLGPPTATSILPGYLSLSSSCSPLFIGGRVVPGYLTAIITYPFAGIFWQPVGLSQGLGSGRDGSVDGEGRTLCSCVTLVASSVVSGSEHLKGPSRPRPRPLVLCCPVLHSHPLIPMMNIAIDHCLLPPTFTELWDPQILLSFLLLTNWPMLPHSRYPLSLNHSPPQ